jgi:hypothetical protein
MILALSTTKLVALFTLGATMAAHHFVLYRIVAILAF